MVDASMRVGERGKAGGTRQYKELESGAGIQFRPALGCVRQVEAGIRLALGFGK